MKENKDHTALMLYVFLTSAMCGFVAGRITKHLHTFHQNRTKHFKATVHGQ